MRHNTEQASAFDEADESDTVLQSPLSISIRLLLYRKCPKRLSPV